MELRLRLRGIRSSASRRTARLTVLSNVIGAYAVSPLTVALGVLAVSATTRYCWIELAVAAGLFGEIGIGPIWIRLGNLRDRRRRVETARERRARRRSVTTWITDGWVGCVPTVVGVIVGQSIEKWCASTAVTVTWLSPESSPQSRLDRLGVAVRAGERRVLIVLDRTGRIGLAVVGVGEIPRRKSSCRELSPGCTPCVMESSCSSWPIYSVIVGVLPPCNCEAPAAYTLVRSRFCTSLVK